MGRACNKNGGEEESQKDRVHLEDQDVGGWAMLKQILER
jgi:hypothetical protein